MTAEPDPSPDSLSRSDLRDAAVSGLRWISIGRVVVEATALIGTVAVARLITPQEFGHAAPAAVLVMLATALTNGGFGGALVQAPNLKRGEIRAAVGLSLCFGVLSTAALLAATPLWAALFPADSVALIQIAAPAFLLASAGAVSTGLLQRDLDFRRVAQQEIVSFLPATVLTVVLAALGYGGLAIVLGLLAQTLLMSTQAMVYRRPPWPGMGRAQARSVLRFGAPASASTLLFTAQRQSTVAILSAQLPAAQAGLYWRAQQLAIDYQGKVSGIMMRLLFPLLSRASTIEDLRAVRTRMVRLHAALLFGPLVLLGVLAPVLVPLIYGPNWADAAQATQLLVLAGLVAVVGTGTGPLLLAMGRPRVLTVYTSVTFVLTVATVAVAVEHGLLVACAALSAFQVLNLIAGQYFIVDRIAGIPIRETLVVDLAPAMVSAAGLAAAAAGTQAILNALDIPALPLVLGASAAGFAAYAAVMRTWFGPTWTELTATAQHLRRRSPVAAD